MYTFTNHSSFYIVGSTHLIMDGSRTYVREEWLVEVYLDYFLFKKGLLEASSIFSFVFEIVVFHIIATQYSPDPLFWTKKTPWFTSHSSHMQFT